MGHRIYVSGSFDPYENLAAEEFLCRNCGEGITLFLWQNRDTVVIGKNQNALRECNIPALRRDGVCLARRSTGGGAVFHDRGNLNFSLIFCADTLDKELGYSLVQGALEKLDIPTQRSGRNDIQLKCGGKVSGNAFRYVDGISLHHGTLLVNSRVERMAEYLRPSFEKLKAHGVESVPARVTNLCHIKPLSVEEVKTALIQSFGEIYGCAAVEEFTGTEECEAIARHLGSPEWLYGRDPASDVSLGRRFDWGSLELVIGLEKGRIKRLGVYTDAMDPFLPEKLEKLLVGSAFASEALSDAVRASDIEGREGLEEWFQSLSI